MAVMSVEVDESISERMAILAEHSRFTVDELHRMALERFLDEEIEQLQGILISDQQIADGRVIPHEEVMAWMRSLHTDNPLPRPRAKVETRTLTHA